MVLTDLGFKRPTFDDILQSQVERAKKLFGEDIDTGEKSVLGKYIRINVHDLAECYEALEEIYYARFPNTASGQSLDRLCVFAGITRNPASAARLKVKIMGSPDSEIPAAFLLLCKDTEFYIDIGGKIGSKGTAELFANCTESGRKEFLMAGMPMEIVNPMSGIASAEIMEVIYSGQEREEESALRVRFQKSVSGIGSASANAIRGAIYRVPLVEGVEIIENNSEIIVEGRPPNSFECFVLAPESQDQLVAEAMFSKKPLGIKCVGSVECTVFDDGNKPHKIRFSRTRRKDIFMKITIEINQFFAAGGESEIKRNICEYMNHFVNGESVYLSGLYGKVHEVHGIINVMKLQISEDNIFFSASNIQVGEFEIARITENAIEIEVLDG